MHAARRQARPVAGAQIQQASLACLALQVAEDQRREAGSLGPGGGVERLLRGGDQLEVAAGEYRIAVLDRFRAWISSQARTLAGMSMV